MNAIRLQTDNLFTPLGLGDVMPSFSWNCEGGVQQTSYQITAWRGNELAWDTGRVYASAMTNIRYGGLPLRSRDRVKWSVRLWDENEVVGTAAESWFENGLLQASDWTAKWIAGKHVAKRNERCPVDCFRRIFSVKKAIKHARLYASACGLYELTLNGQLVGDAALVPGNTDIRKRIQYQTYDVTDMLVASNTLEALLADGWYRGSVGAFGPRNVYGRQTKLLCQLEITYIDDTCETIGTDIDWDWSNDGSIRFADLEDGEVVDASMQPSYADKSILASIKGLPTPTASDNVLPKRHERFKGKLIITPSGKKVIDFGQNLAGFIAFDIHGQQGQSIKLRLGEILDKDGEFTQRNMQEVRPVKEYTPLTEVLFVTGMSKFYKGKTQPTPLQEVVFTCSAKRITMKQSFQSSAFAMLWSKQTLISKRRILNPWPYTRIWSKPVRLPAPIPVSTNWSKTRVGA